MERTGGLQLGGQSESPDREEETVEDPAVAVCGNLSEAAGSAGEVVPLVLLLGWLRGRMGAA